MTDIDAIFAAAGPALAVVSLELCCLGFLGFVLDEVDAALDDANIAVFNRMVADIASHSQVLMITHNKRSMETADTL